ncbi:hypothetical protein [Bacillus coahuilensis]|uniref:hypothetical protein n=1 Tax=Bacillus coahuilensis TaxID=408580 RepID=UPI0001851230|nr:hypothetical protein [Bacillus coahuilensis]
MAKLFPNVFSGEVLTTSELPTKKRRELFELGFLVNFFKPNQYNGNEYYVLRKKVGDFYKFEKVSRYGTKNRLPLLLLQGWEIVKAPAGVPDKETEEE